MTTKSAFCLDAIALNMDLNAHTIVATYGDLRQEYALAEFINDHDAPLGHISMVSLMLAARVKFANAQVVA